MTHRRQVVASPEATRWTTSRHANVPVDMAYINAGNVGQVGPISCKNSTELHDFMPKGDQVRTCEGQRTDKLTDLQASSQRIQTNDRDKKAGTSASKWRRSETNEQGRHIDEASGRLLREKKDTLQPRHSPRELL